MEGHCHIHKSISQPFPLLIVEFQASNLQCPQCSLQTPSSFLVAISICLVFELDCVSTKCKASKEYATENRQEVSNIHGHDRQHAANILATASNCNGCRSLQKIANASNDSIHNSTNRVRSDSPWSNTHAPLSHNHNILLNSILRQDHPLAIAR
jgi:hypothetical protein